MEWDDECRSVKYLRHRLFHSMSIFCVITNFCKDLVEGLGKINTKGHLTSVISDVESCDSLGPLKINSKKTLG